MKDCYILYERTIVYKNAVLFDLKDDSYIIQNVEYEITKCETFKFDGIRYYLLVRYGSEEGPLGKPVSASFVHIYANIIDCTIVDYNNRLASIDHNIIHNKKIIFANSDEKTEFPFHLLQQRCELIKSIFDDIYFEDSENIFPVKLDLNNYKNFELYKEFITCGTYDINRVYDLFKLCDYLHDIGTEHLASVIVTYVNNNKMKINKAFKYLQLLHSSTCHRHLEILLNIIFNRYERRDFLERIQDESVRMNVYIQKYLWDHKKLD